jgi:hypothetical protein
MWVGYCRLCFANLGGVSRISATEGKAADLVIEKSMGAKFELTLDKKRGTNHLIFQN